MPTLKQKAVIRYLSQGGSIVTMGRGVYTVRDQDRISKLRCEYNTIFRLKNYLVKKIYKKSACWLLNKKAVIALRKNHSFKKIYLENRKTKL
jgi:hypothetical protein